MARQDLDPFDKGDMEVQEIEAKYSSTDEQIVELEKKIKRYQTEAMLAKQNGDPETLSNTLISLARINSALDGRGAYATYIARNAERAYRRTREQIKLNHIADKQAIGKAESMGYVDKKTEEAFQLWSKVQLLADTASGLAYRTDSFLKMAQSGLSLIKNDINGRP